MTRVPAQEPAPALADSQGPVAELTRTARPPLRRGSAVAGDHTGRCGQSPSVAGDAAQQGRSVRTDTTGTPTGLTVLTGWRRPTGWPRAVRRWPLRRAAGQTVGQAVGRVAGGVSGSGRVDRLGVVGRVSRVVRVAGVPLVLALVALSAAPGVVPVRRGDTLWDLARTHNTTVAALRHLNSLPGDTIYAGQTLLVPTDGAGRSSATRTHRVRPGDTVGEIAQRYGVPTSALAARNGLAGAMRIYPGQQLKIPASSTGSTHSTAGSTTPRPTTSDDEAEETQHADGAEPDGPAGPGGTLTPSGQWHYPQRVTDSAARHQADLSDRPAPSKEHIRGLIRQTARDLGVDEALALAIAEQESGFRMNVVSPADAIGTMQVLPSTARWLSRDVVGRDLDLLDSEDNVLAGVALLRLLTRAAPLDQAVAGYYQGLSSVRTRGMYQDTKRYVANVLALRARWQ